MSEIDAILAAYGRDGDPAAALVAADYHLDRGESRLAASALDRAWGLDPGDAFATRQRQAVLDSLVVVERGIRFRYVPAGTFLMGSESGECDERPVHPVRLPEYWISETPISWATYCDLMGWEPPPSGRPGKTSTVDRPTFYLHEENKIRLQYCETATRGARDWHAHVPDQIWERGDGSTVTAAELFGPVDRDDPSRPFRYNVKPMVAVSWQEAEEMCRRISTDTVEYRLPGEAEWEKAARGGLIGATYSWGDEPPDPARADFGHFGEFAIKPPQLFPGNGYGLLGMCGGVWEWTGDVYDALAYLGERNAPAEPNESGEPGERVLRGGSFTDCAEAITVSFRMSRGSMSWRQERAWGGQMTPNVGFRVCRLRRSSMRSAGGK